MFRGYLQCLQVIVEELLPALALLFVLWVGYRVHLYVLGVLGGSGDSRSG